MKNLKYFPYERNNYYYGKLLTDKDFIKEQQYFNNKRRLHNRFFHGFGVVAGLGALAIDERTLSVEDGVAVDFAGREIVVHEPMLYKLSMISGFQQLAEQSKADHVYLCIEYNEEPKNVTQSIVAGQSTENFEVSVENFHLYLTEKEPEAFQLGAEHMNLFTYVLFENEQIKITQEFYKTIPSGDYFEVRFTVLNKGNASNVEVQLQQQLEGAFLGTETALTVSFTDLFLERGQSASQTVTLRAKQLDIGTIHFILAPENVKILINRKKCVASEKQTIEVPISRGNSLDVLKNEYFANVMEDIVTNNFGGGIYLAKIFLVRKNKSFFIESVEPMPGEQYVYSTHLLAGMVKELERNLESMKRKVEEKTTAPSAPVVTAPAEEQTAQGTVEIPLTFPAKTGQVKFSHEIFHNLGEGPFTVEFCAQEKDQLFAGEAGIFPDRKVKAKFEVKQNIKKASFIFGLKLLESTEETSVFLRYTVKKEKERQKVERKTLYIVPSKLELQVRESFYLEAMHNTNGTVLWSVTGNNAGSISKDGTYTAPNVAGVYEVVAMLEQEPEMKTSLFVVVRE